jgi:hypothetical protein
MDNANVWEVMRDMLHGHRDYLVIDTADNMIARTSSQTYAEQIVKEHNNMLAYRHACAVLASKATAKPLKVKYKSPKYTRRVNVPKQRNANNSGQ